MLAYKQLQHTLLAVSALYPGFREMSGSLPANPPTQFTNCQLLTLKTVAYCINNPKEKTKREKGLKDAETLLTRTSNRVSSNIYSLWLMIFSVDMKTALLNYCTKELIFK